MNIFGIGTGKPYEGRHLPESNHLASTNGTDSSGVLSHVPNLPVRSVPLRIGFTNQQVDSQIKFEEFRSLTRELYVLDKAIEKITWDLQVDLPPKAVNTCAEYLEVLSSMRYKILTSHELGELVNYLKACPADLNEFDNALLNLVREEREKTLRLPKEFIERKANLIARTQISWEEARAKKDFNSFAPLLQQLVDLKRKEVGYLGYLGSPYNALLDQYEKGLTVEKLDSLVAKLKKELIPLVKTLHKCSIGSEIPFLLSRPNESKMTGFREKLLGLIGFDLEAGKLATSAHPFSSNQGLNDNRITTQRGMQPLILEIGTVIHEGGHGLFAQGLDPRIANTLLGDSSSYGIDEAQGRFYETSIGYGKSFWIYLLPELKKRFPDELGGIDLETFYKAINVIKPTPTRLDADEISFQLHIIIRYEIERDLIEGKIEVKDLPRIWNEKTKEYLGIEPKDDSEGVLQDGHWASGDFGYFPVYLLGNIYASQIYGAMKRDIHDLEDQISKGNLRPIKLWLNEKINKYGKMKTTPEIVRLATGNDLNPDCFLRYITEKYSKLYPEAFPK